MKITVNAAINVHKVLVAPLIISLMWYFKNWGAPAFLYLGLHGTYSFLWIIKQNLFPDKRFEEKIPVLIAVLTPFLPLCAYYLAPYLLISQYAIVPSWVFAVAPIIFTIGIFLHYVGDAQKYYVLKNKGGLIEEGLFKHTRNPNYLGEILIYGSFVLISWHWVPLMVLASWSVYFFINMRKKDKSLSRYPNFAAYKNTTGMLLPYW